MCCVYMYGVYMWCVYLCGTYIYMWCVYILCCHLQQHGCKQTKKGKYFMISLIGRLEETKTNTKYGEQSGG